MGSGDADEDTSGEGCGVADAPPIWADAGRAQEKTRARIRQADFIRRPFNSQNRKAPVRLPVAQDLDGSAAFQRPFDKLRVTVPDFLVRSKENRGRHTGPDQ